MKSLKTKLVQSLILAAVLGTTACGSSNGLSLSGVGSAGVAGPVVSDPIVAEPEVTYHSCKEILAANPTSADGHYTIELGETNTTTDVFCDMTTDGGGWTVILDGTNTDRAALNKYFENTSETDLPESRIHRDPNKGMFWTDQELIAKNMPASTEVRLIFSLSYLDPVFGTNCYAILGIKSPYGYQVTDPNSFTAFAQKNDTSSYVKATYNLDQYAEDHSVQVNAMASYPHPFVNGSRVWAGNPYGFGNTCSTFYIKRLMVR